MAKRRRSGRAMRTVAARSECVQAIAQDQRGRLARDVLKEVFGEHRVELIGRKERQSAG